MPNTNWLNVPRYPACAVALTSFAASWTTKVYFSVNKGAVPVAEGRVSHVTAPVGPSTVWFVAIVYAWLFALQVAIISMKEGVTTSEV